MSPLRREQQVRYVRWTGAVIRWSGVVVLSIVFSLSGLMDMPIDTMDMVTFVTVAGITAAAWTKRVPLTAIWVILAAVHVYRTIVYFHQSEWLSMVVAALVFYLTGWVAVVDRHYPSEHTLNTHRRGHDRGRRRTPRAERN